MYNVYILVYPQYTTPCNQFKPGTLLKCLYQARIVSCLLICMLVVSILFLWFSY